MWILFFDYSIINGEVINKKIIIIFIYLELKNKLLNNLRVIKEIMMKVKIIQK